MKRRRRSYPFGLTHGAGFINSPSFPGVAVFRSGDGWVVRDNNTARPDGYVVTRDSGASFVIDDAAVSGLTLKIIDGRPYVSYP